MRILAGGPTREAESDLFELHRESLEAQAGSWELAVEHEVVPPVAEQERARWPRAAVERVARSRQRFMDRAESEFDALFMVDSDVVLGPGVLARLLEVDADVVYGVFWSVWPGWSEPMPQVWDIHPYAHTPEFVREFAARDGVWEREVLGGGACTVFRGRAFESRYWPLLRGLQSPDWYGEDRSYCIGLECSDIKQVAVFGLPIFHLYSRHQQTPEALSEARERCEL